MKVLHIIAVVTVTSLGAVLASCDAVGPAPSDMDVRAALAHYFETAPVRANGAPMSERGTGEDDVGIHSERGGDANGTDDDTEIDGDVEDRIIIEDDKCVRMRVIKRRQNGKVVEERVELPCDIADTVEAGVSAGLRAFSDALKGVSSAVERELRHFHVTAVADAEVIACVPAGDRPGHICDVDAELVYGGDDRRVETLTGRFVRGPRGWRVLALESAG